MIQVIDGKGEVTIGGKPFILKAGEAIIMPANIPHAVNAVEKFKMVLSMIRSK
jgi:quercetin dioxygenase-like cupin family protein